jgi:hypothetical protein
VGWQQVIKKENTRKNNGKALGSSNPNRNPNVAQKKSSKDKQK